MEKTFFRKLLSMFLITATVLLTCMIQPTAYAGINDATNGDASTLNLTGWTVTNSCGNGWTAGGGTFASSFYTIGGYDPNSNPTNWCAMEQTIDLLALGYSTAFLDSANEIKVGTTVYGVPNGIGITYDYDFYSFKVVLKDGDGATIATYDTYDVGDALSYKVGASGPADGGGQPTYTFSGYGAGVRSIYIQQRGVDTGFWGGQYGSYFDNTYVKLLPSISTLSPADNATSVALDANLVMTFDQAVTIGTGNITIKKTSDNTTIETINVTSGQVTGGGTSTITINPSVTLTNGVEYYVLVDAGTFTDASSNDYHGISSTTEWSFTTVKANQSITFDELVAKNHGSDSFNLTATASSGLTVSYTSSNTDVATITGNTVTIVGAGTTTITASQTGNSTYNAASNVERTLTVNAIIPTLTTTSPSSISTTTATGGGTISSDGGNTVTVRGICWSLTYNPTTTNNCTTNGTGTGTFTSSITDLEALTTYHVRAYATNSIGTAYGADTTFTTTDYSPIYGGGSGSITTYWNSSEEENTTEDSSTTEEQAAPNENEDENTEKTCEDLSKDHWAYPYIKNLLSADNYPTIETAGVFYCRPDDQLTRGSLVEWIVSIRHAEELENFNITQVETSPFNDIDTDSVYAPSIILAHELGIIDGYQDGSFKPENTINRAELLKILLNEYKGFGGTEDELSDLKSNSPEKNPLLLFKDIQDENAWYFTYLYYASSKNIITGKSFIENGVKIKKAEMTTPALYSEAAKMLFTIISN